MSNPLSHRIALDTDLSYHVLEWGADDTSRDHTVVLIHGYLDLAWGWEPTVRAGLAERFHVIAPDMRGHGDSDRVGRGGYYHFVDYVADLRSLVRQLGRERVSIVGHSMGGNIASYYTGSYPDSVHRLAILEGLGPPEGQGPMPERVRQWVTSWRRARERGQGSYASIDEAAQRLRQHDPLLGAEMAHTLAEKGTVAQADGRLRFKHDPLHVTRGPHPFRLAFAGEFWANIRCPVLLVDGSEASLFRHDGAEAERRLAYFKTDVRREVLAGAAHMMHRHRPAALAALLADFLGD